MKSAEETKAFVLEAFDLLFNQRDYATAARFWSENYIQHSAHIPPGRDGLFTLVRNAPSTLRYENARIVVDGNWVMLHGRFSGHGRPRAWIAADILRMEGGLLAEHWDVLQDEATKSESQSGLPMLVLRSQKQISTDDDRPLLGTAVVFGSGKRYFGSVDAQHLLEDPDVAIQGNRVLHLRYRVRR